MRKTISTSHFIIFIIILSLSAAGCKLQSTATPTNLPTPTSTQTATSPPVSSSSIPQPTQTPTRQHTPTPPPEPEAISRSAIPIDECQPADISVKNTLTSSILASDNIENLSELARWGLGTFDDLALSPNGSLLAAASSKGVYFYDANLLTLICFLEIENGVNVIDFSPDSSWLAYGTDIQIHLWSMTSGEQIAAWDAHNLPVNDIAFSPDGAILASGSSDNTVRIWQTADNDTGKVVGDRLNIFYEHQHGLAFSPDGASLVFGVGSTVKHYRIADGILLHTVQRQLIGDVTSVNFSSDGLLLALGAGHNRAEIWQLSDYTMLYALGWEWNHPNTVTDVAFSPDNSLLAAASDDQSIELWQVKDGTLLTTLEGHGGSVKSVVFSPDGHWLVGASRGDPLRKWQTGDGQLLASVNGETAEIKKLAFPSDGKQLAIAANNSLIQVWNLDPLELEYTIRGYPRPIQSLAFSPDGETLATAGWFSAAWNSPRTDYQAVAQLWRAKDGLLQRTFTWGHEFFGPTSSAAFNLSQNLIIAGSGSGSQTGAGTFISWNGYIRLWDLVGQKLVSTYNLLWLERPQTSSALDNNNLKNLIESSPNFVGPITHLAYSMDGARFASRSYNGYINLWEPAAGNVAQHTVWEHDGETQELVYSPDGKKLAVIAPKGVRLWDTSSGGSLLVMSAGLSPLISGDFSPGGRLIAAGAQDGTIMIWQTSDGVLLSQLNINGAVTALKFAPAGDLIAVGTDVGETTLFGIAP